MTKIVISGANRGIGLALVREYIGRGARIVGLVRNANDAQALRTLADIHQGVITIVEMDQTDGVSISAAARAVNDDPVDLLLNVAGILGGSRQSLEDSNFDAWRACFETNTIGPFRLAQAFLPQLVAARGKIVTISTQIAASTWPYGDNYAYAASKAALNRVMRGLALDLRDNGVAVAIVHPGYVRTDMGGPNADISPEQSAVGIADVAARLDLATSGSFFDWNGVNRSW